VCASGHALNDGFGVSSYTWGLAVDWIVGATAILANSTIVDVLVTENTDLFLAIRGAGLSMRQLFQFMAFGVRALVIFFVVSAPRATQGRALNDLRAVKDIPLNTMPAELNIRVLNTGRFVDFGAFSMVISQQGSPFPLRLRLPCSGHRRGRGRESRHPFQMDWLLTKGIFTPMRVHPPSDS
jgi:hypothetical protein